ncbi:hypothetical protein BGX33_011683 [Mortierella sp. NVP41]|nr:hypothetical protein BGX33_011683 [Mortierella sp. NVP41]
MVLRSVSSNPPPAAGKVQGMARKFSLMAKQAGENNYVPRNNIEKQPIVTGAVKPKVATAAAATVVTKAPEVVQKKYQEEEQVVLESPADAEQEIEPTLQVSELTSKVEEIELAVEEKKEKVVEEDKKEEAAPVVVEEPVVEEPIHEEPVEEIKEQEQEPIVAEVVKATVEVVEAEAPIVVEEKKVEAEAPVVVEEKVEEVKEEAPVAVEAPKQDTQSTEEEEIKNAPIEA